MLHKLGIMAAGKGNRLTRIFKSIGNAFLHPWDFARTILNFKSATRSAILLVMQTLDNSMTMRWKNSIFGGKMAIDNRKPGYQRVPTYIQSGQDVMNRFAEKSGGVSQNAFTEIFFNMSTTAHILGGCPMGISGNEGVVDDQFKVHNYPNMYILDGSIIPCNPGVNPSLTITALGEYAMGCIPDKSGNNQISLEELLSKNKRDI